MDRNIKLTISKPCSKKFDEFEPTPAGGFCDSCRKEVTDFTGMSDREILHYFKNEPKNTCGYLRKSQLKTYSEVVPSKRKQKWNALGAGLMSFSLLSLISTYNSQAQQRTSTTEIHVPQKEHDNTKSKASQVTDQGHVVEGTVLDESDTPVPGAIVILKGTTIGTTTDFDGKFKFPQPLKTGDVLLFSYIGYKTQEFKVSKDTPPSSFTISMKFDAFDLVFMGEVTTNRVYTSKRSFWQKLKGIFR